MNILKAIELVMLARQGLYSGDGKYIPPRRPGQPVATYMKQAARSPHLTERIIAAMRKIAPHLEEFDRDFLLAKLNRLGFLERHFPTVFIIFEELEAMLAKRLEAFNRQCEDFEPEAGETIELDEIIKKLGTK